ncbi:hypothetical protein M422DRAFT_63582 [Sphaerobolus stellatus SS14]|nr:hypothetical protein M422DRAFT_63582 [Sphaerobolus stellatus SS14]
MPTFLDLPLELLPLILSHIVKPQHLVECCLVNKEFNDFGTPQLYSRIYIYAWHKNGKAKAARLFRTLSEHPHLAKRVYRLELRDFPKAIFSDSYDNLLQSCLKGLSNCSNLRSCTWTRDRTLSTEFLGVLSSLPSLKHLEINGHSTGTYDPQALLRFKTLEKISLIMPSAEVIAILPAWTQKVKDTLNTFHVLCKASPLITDSTLDAMAPYMTRLQHLHIAGCPRITHKGILAVISNTQDGIKSLGLEGLSPSLDISELSNSAVSAFNNLKSLTLSFHAGISTEIWTSSLLTLTSQTRLEELHLYVAASTKKPNVETFGISDVLEAIIPLHSETLHKVSVNRLPISTNVVGMICSLCPKLESLFVIMNYASLTELIPQLAKSKSVRNIHINFPPIGQFGRIPPSEILRIGSQLGSQVRQLGFSNRVYQLERIPKIKDTGEVELELVLGTYEQPQVPEQFLVVRT